MRLIFNSAAITLATLAAAPAIAQSCNEGFRAFEHAAGETCIPNDPQRIASLNDLGATTTLIELGAPLIGTTMRTMDDGSLYVRGASDIIGQAAVDALGLINLGGNNPVDVEQIAAAEPDLIIAGSWQSEQYDALSQIAPTIVGYSSSEQPFFDQLEFLAQASATTGAYDAALAEYRARVEEVRDRVGDPGSIIISKLDLADDGLWYYPEWGGLEQVIDDVGFAQPAYQAEATEQVNGLSVERIMEFDGDIILTGYAPRFGQDVDELIERHNRVAPFWRDLSGVQSGNHFWYERDLWSATTFSALNNALDGLELLAAGQSSN